MRRWPPNLARNPPTSPRRGWSSQPGSAGRRRRQRRRGRLLSAKLPPCDPPLPASSPPPTARSGFLGAYCFNGIFFFWLLFWSLNVILAASNVSTLLPGSLDGFSERSQRIHFLRSSPLGGQGPGALKAARRPRLGLSERVCAVADGAPGWRRRLCWAGRRSRRIFLARSPCTATSLGPLGLIYVVRGSSRQSRGGGGGASRSPQ